MLNSRSGAHRLPRKGVRYRLGIAAVVAAVGVGAPFGIAAAAQSPSTPASVAPGPDDDSFYTPPSTIPDGAPGDIIRWRPSTIGAPEVDVNAWQVMYRSTNALGKPDAVTGTVLVPKNVDPATAPIVSFAAGTQGPGFGCAPSKMLGVGAFYEQSGLDDLLHSGYAVVLTDYEGYHQNPTTTYIVGQSEGHAVIDMVRAAQRLPETKLSAAAKVAFRGYSQGGGAVMWAGQMQPTYAPDMKLVGVAGGGVPANLAAVALGLDGKKGFGFLAYAAIGLDNAYPELKLDSFLTDKGRAQLKEIAGECTLDLVLKHENQSFVKDYTTSSPFANKEWLDRVRENQLGTEPIKVPVFDYHATKDDFVDYNQGAQLRQKYCKLGVAVSWKTYPTDHITGIYDGNADVLNFIKDRMAGKAATPNC